MKRRRNLVRRNVLLSLLLLLLSVHVSAQQLTHFSHYMLNGFLVNPALAGSENYGEVRAGFRSQWTGVEGAPESYYVTAHMPLSKSNRDVTATSVPYRGRTGSRSLFQEYRKSDVQRDKSHHGVGFSAVMDKAGALRRTNLSVTYAYHLPLGKSLKLSSGISGGAALYRIDQEGLRLTDPSDATFTGGEYDRVFPTLTAGTMLYTKRFYLGLSSAQFLQDEFSAEQTHTARTVAHHYVSGGYKVVLTPMVSLLPSVMVKYASPAPVSVDANLKVLYRDVAWAGLSLRQHNTAVVLGGVNLGRIMQLGYAYELGRAGMDRISGGSHEVVLGFFLSNNDKVFSPSEFW